MNQHPLLIRVLLTLLVYLLLQYLGGSLGALVLYPVTLIVTFLHEFGHGIGAILTGGRVEALQINSDGSGYTVTSGGIKSIILMGGYLGSALLGNLLFYIAAKKPHTTVSTLYFLALTMVFVAIFWFNSIYTSLFLVFSSYCLYFVASRRFFHQELLLFLGLAATLYIIQDFNIGPRSDLELYAQTMAFLPSVLWMYVWLFIALLICFWNLRMIFRAEPS